MASHMNPSVPAAPAAPAAPACLGGRFREFDRVDGSSVFAIQCNCGPPGCAIVQGKWQWSRTHRKAPRPPYHYDPAKHGTTFEDIDRIVNPPVRRSGRSRSLRRKTQE